MARIEVVEDVDDPRLDDFRDLTHSDRRPDRAGGRGRGLVIAEGVPVVQRLLASPYPLRAVLGVAPRIDALADDLADQAAPAYVTSADLMARVVGFHLNRGVLATADRAPTPAPADLLRTARRVAVLEGVNDAENLGGIFRNAAGLGVDGILLGDRCADPLYRRSVRVSMGHVLRVPFTTLTEPWPAALDILKRNGFRLRALTPHPPALDISTVDPTGREAILLGAEGPGLTAAALAAADDLVRIPMESGVDSLNVATAAAIAFHALRP